MSLSKIFLPQTACSGITDGATVLVGGFGQPGTPNLLLKHLVRHGARDLTVVKNDAGEPGLGVSLLLESARVKKMITSHIGLNPLAVDMMNRGELLVDVYPQGILAEKIRAAGAGLGGILTDIGLHLVKDDQQCVEVDGRAYKLEVPIRGDVALIHAALADEFGNLVFSKTAANFNLVMAMAADLVIVEAKRIVAPGAIDPNRIHLPGAFVDRLVLIDEPGADYGVLKHHAL